jgi:hypothetical protein
VVVREGQGRWKGRGEGGGGGTFSIITIENISIAPDLCQ